MAELTDAYTPGSTGARLSWQQFGAIAWLRWRILANGFRRKGGAGELIARILLIPLFALLALMPALLAGFFSWYLSMHGPLQHIAWVLWAAFILTQLLNINLGQPGTTFDPSELIRFPMALRSFVLVRLCFGLLSPANVIVSLMSLAIFIGITIDRPGLWPFTLLATFTFALTNILFTRMVFAWIDRWLSTRRAREVFTAIIFAGSLLFQYLNVTLNPGFQHKNRRHQVTSQNLQRMQHVARVARPYATWLPPELIGSAINAASERRPLPFLAKVGGCGAFALAFLAIYGVRMRTEYHGENLSDQANAVRSTPRRPAHAPVPAAAPVTAAPALSSVRNRVFPPTLGPLLGKEILVLRRNTGLLYGVIAPTVMVFLFAGRVSIRGSSHWLLMTAVAYALLGIAPMSYNSFGLEGTGSQFYFMAPVPLREVFFAKNVMGFLLAMFEVVSVILIVAYVATRPTLADCLFVVLWALATLLLNTTLGNLRSISAPKKINPGKTMNRAASQVSAWMAMGILAGSAALGVGCQYLATFLHQPWLAVGLMAALAIGAIIVYEQGLRGIETYAMERRDTLFEELGKKI